jgi:hypothetical protein
MQYTSLISWTELEILFSTKWTSDKWTEHVIQLCDQVSLFVTVLLRTKSLSLRFLL